MSLTRGQETWAIALHLERVHGAEAPAFIVARIGALAAKGDMAGVGRWREIANAYDRLMSDKAAN